LERLPLAGFISSCRPCHQPHACFPPTTAIAPITIHTKRPTEARAQSWSSPSANTPSSQPLRAAMFKFCHTIRPPPQKGDTPEAATCRKNMLELPTRMSRPIERRKDILFCKSAVVCPTTMWVTLAPHNTYRAHLGRGCWPVMPPHMPQQQQPGSSVCKSAM